MRKLLEKIDHQIPGLLGLLLILTGLFFSRAAMSIGMMVLLGNALLNLNLREIFHRFIRHPVMPALTGIFIVYLLSGINSANTAFWLDRLRMKLPFLILPFAFLAIPRFNLPTYHRILYLFFWLIAILCLHSLIIFFRDYDNITELYRQGKVMPTPVFHIRFSLMAAYAVAVGWYLFQKEFFVWRPVERFIVLAVSIFLIIYLHLLAVRSGLFALYSVLVYFLLFQIVRRRQYLAGAAVLFLLGFSVLLTYRFVPTLKNKIDYTIYSLHMFQRNQNLEELSDSYRLGSIKAGLSLSGENLWTGVGIGDLKDECNRYFAAHFPALANQELMPHNQFIFILSAAGIFALLFFTWAIIQPLRYRKGYRDQLILAFHIIIFSSFLVEHTIETQLGTAFYLLFLLMGVRTLDEVKTEKS